jgi:hypothetical protein
LTTDFEGTPDLGVFLFKLITAQLSKVEQKIMRRNTESILLMFAAKVISELRSRTYGATPVNTSGNED